MGPPDLRRTPKRRRAVPVAAAVLAVVTALGLAGCSGGDGTGGPQAGPDRDVAVVPSPDDDPPVAGQATGDEAAPDDDSLRRRGGPTGDGLDDPGSLADLAERAERGAARDRERRPVLGADVSWPQCPRGLGIPEKRSLGLPMPPPEAEYVVVGLTNGPGFVENPCLADQVAWVTDRALLLAAYAVVSYPDEATVRREGGQGPFDPASPVGALGNVGYQQARFAVASMRRTGLETPVVWVDVEPVNDFEWSGDRAANAAVVRGAVRGYRDAGYDVGVYSTPYLWESIVGDLRLGLPEWRAAGPTSREEALERCAGSWTIQGGPAVLGQWVEDSRDLNVTCPGTAAELGRWFHRSSLPGS